MRLTIYCPHCDSRATGIKTRRVTQLVTEVTYQCRNVLCGHTYVALAEIVRTLSPSACPRADVSLPLSSHIRRRLLTAQLDGMPVAETSDEQERAALSRNRDLFEEGLAIAPS